jgi:hypothetical protein
VINQVADELANAAAEHAIEVLRRPCTRTGLGSRHIVKASSLQFSNAHVLICLASSEEQKITTRLCPKAGCDFVANKSTSCHTFFVIIRIIMQYCWPEELLAHIKLTTL